MTQTPESLERKGGQTSDLLNDLREYFGKPICHYECEDSWYSCPLSTEGCADDKQTECTCGQPERSKQNAEYVARIDAAIAVPGHDEIAAAITRQFRDEMNGRLVDRIAEFVRSLK